MTQPRPGGRMPVFCPVSKTLLAIMAGITIAGQASAQKIVQTSQTANKKEQAQQAQSFERVKENGVTVWRAKVQPVAVVTPEIVETPPVVVTKTIVKKEKVIVPRFRPAKIRVIGHFSGYGKRIPFVQGFYSGYPRSKNSRKFVQGFYSGYKTNKKRRFPLERPDGRRRVY